MALINDMDIIIEDHPGRKDKKSLRKQKRAYYRLLRDMNIKCTDEPTQHLMICNGGLVTGIKRETLHSVLDALISKYKLIMPSGKSYCFITCNTKEDATCTYNYIHGRMKLPGQKGPLYVCYTEGVPDTDDNVPNYPFPPGLTLIENFITKEQEESLLKTLEDWDNCETVSSQLKHRYVKHFGYEFKYLTNTVDFKKPITPIPEDYKFLQSLFDKHGHKYTYDQLTINKYLPGQGIPPHIDTHEGFEDTILSLSLGSSCVMNFQRMDRKIDVLLPPRSLLIMTGEARYDWNHGICPRRSDVIDTENGLTILERGTRISFTFRKVRQARTCYCYREQCDSECQDHTLSVKSGSQFESLYVHKVYEEVCHHFSETRHKQWPNVAKFLANLEEGTLLLDVGCGNGKYMFGNQNIYKIGCDRSLGLLNICHKRGFQALLSDCLHLPYRDGSFNAAICIAVIHHLSSHARRKRVICEIMRVLRPRGKCLIYVWAKEQHKYSHTFYLKSGLKKKENVCKNGNREANCEFNNCLPSIDPEVLEYHLTGLPIHTNKTSFAYSDMLVPWTKQNGKRTFRYYHVFKEGELAELCAEVPEAAIKHLFYDEGNWCVVLEKNTEYT